MIDSTRSKIEDSLKLCLGSLPNCQTILELIVPGEIMIRQVASIIRPDCDVEFTPLKKDPQDIVNKEEKKEEVAPYVDYWTDKLTVAIKKRAQKRLNQAQKMLENKAIMTQSLNRMQLLNVHSFQFQKQAIEAISKEIKELQSEENRNFALKQTIVVKTIDKVKQLIEQMKIETRYTAPYMDILKVQNQEYPQKSEQSFDNYLVSVQNNNAGEFRFKFYLGDNSDVKQSEQLKEIKILPEGTEIKRAVVWYNPSDGFLTWIELFDKEGLTLLEAGFPLSERQQHNNQTHEIILEEGERIIGFQSRSAQSLQAGHLDFQFLLGKLI